MKRTAFAIALFAVLAVALLLQGCNVEDVDVAGKTYVYTGETVSGGFGGEFFTIDINEDGTFEYYEGPLSSYFGIGEWSLTNNVLTLHEQIGDRNASNSFRVKGGSLIFIENGSDNFTHVTVKNGERFTCEQ